MSVSVHLVRDRRGAAALEMALVLPIFLILMLGSAELGNYFVNEHSLVKAVRDGARFAARQSFTNYTACSGSPGGTVVADTKNVVINGYMSGGTRITPNIKAADITVTTSCSATVTGGIYRTRPSGAQIVTVTAAVDYMPILRSFGFRGIGFKLNATEQAAVAGV